MPHCNKDIFVFVIATTEYPESFLFFFCRRCSRCAVLFVDTKKKWNIKRCISKSISIVVPVILSSLHSVAIRSFFFAFFLFIGFLFIFRDSHVLFGYNVLISNDLFVLVSNPKVSSNILFIKIRTKWNLNEGPRTVQWWTMIKNKKIKMPTLNFVDCQKLV